MSHPACYKDSGAFAACNTATSDPGHWCLVAVEDIPSDLMSNRLSAVAVAVDDAAAVGPGYDAGEQYSGGENAADGEEQDPVADDGCDAA